MELRVIYVMTHDSIGLGEDGPTHQPVEHLAALARDPAPAACSARPTRSRPRNAGQLALRTRATRPSMLALTRQGVPLLRRDAQGENRSARGAYVLAEAEGARQVTLLATGSEVVDRDRGARSCWRSDGHRAPRSSRCRAGNCSRRQDAAYRARGARQRAAGRGRGGVALRLGALARRARRVCRHDAVSAPRRRPRRSIRISASPPRRSPRRRCSRIDRLIEFDRDFATEDEHGDSGCDQRLRPHRPAGAARASETAPRRSRGRRRSTISARSRPTRICCNTTACTAASRGEITTGDNWMDVGRGKIRVTAERDPAKLPWKELGVDVALECTGIFTKREAAAKHLEAGAKKVIVSAPADGVDFTVVHGRQPRRAEAPSTQVISNALVHDQLPGAGRLCAARGHRHRARLHDDDPLLYRRPEPVDTLHSDLRRARAAALSMIPTSTGAARAVGLVLPALKGKLDGTAIRVPTANVSLIDFTFDAARETTRRRDQRADGEAAKSNRLQGHPRRSTRRRPCRSTSTTTRTARPST